MNKTKLTHLSFMLFFSLLFFSSMCDRILNFHISSFNFRVAQVLLAVSSLIILSKWRKNSFQSEPILKNGLTACATIFLFQLLLVPFRNETVHTLIKLVWICFNLGGCGLLFLFSAQRKKEMVSSGKFAIFLVGAIIMIDWIGICSTGSPWIGLSQTTFNDLQRPHAFYYEPSYAAAMLGLGLALFVNRPAVVSCLIFAIYLTSSRTGAAMAVVWAGLFLLFVKFNKQIFIKLLSIAGMSIALIGLSTLHPTGMAYFTMQKEKLFSREAVSRVAVPEYSEGQRLETAKSTLANWKQSPIIGSGFVSMPTARKSLEPTAMNTWLEVLSEFGLSGALLLALILALLFYSSGTPAVKAAILAHALINLNFTQTFPRLDYWLVLTLLVTQSTKNNDEVALEV